MTSGPSLEQRLRQHLDREAEGLDAASLSRLRRARAAATEAAHAGAPRRWLRAAPRALPAAAAAALLGLAVGLSLWHRPPVPELELQALGGDEQVLIEIAEAELDIEMIEDIEFYDWLALAQAQGDTR